MMTDQYINHPRPWDFLGGRRGQRFEVPPAEWPWFLQNCEQPVAVLRDAWRKTLAKYSPQQRALIRAVQGATSPENITHKSKRIEAELRAEADDFIRTHHDPGGDPSRTFEVWVEGFVHQVITSLAPEHREHRPTYLAELARVFRGESDGGELADLAGPAGFSPDGPAKHIAKARRLAELRHTMPEAQREADAAYAAFDSLDQRYPTHNRERIAAHTDWIRANRRADLAREEWRELRQWADGMGLSGAHLTPDELSPVTVKPAKPAKAKREAVTA